MVSVGGWSRRFRCRITTTIKAVEVLWLVSKAVKCTKKGLKRKDKYQWRRPTSKRTYRSSRGIGRCPILEVGFHPSLTSLSSRLASGWSQTRFSRAIWVWKEELIRVQKKEWMPGLPALSRYDQQPRCPKMRHRPYRRQSSRKRPEEVKN